MTVISLAAAATSDTNNLLDQLDAVRELDRILEQTKNTDMWSEFLTSMLTSILNFGISLLKVIIIYLIGVQLIKYIRKLVKRAMTKASVETGTIHFIDLVVKAILYIILIAVIVSRYGTLASSMAALLGSAGLAVGLAFQGSLSNFAGGVLLLLLHPFKVGDYIIEDVNKNEGTVQKIELFYTTLITSDNRVITIPNGTLANSSLTNATAQDKRRLDILISISYNADLKLVKSSIEDILKEESGTLKEEEILTFVDQLGEHAVIVGARAWCKKEDHWKTKCSVLEKIKLTFDRYGIEMAAGRFDVNIKNAKEDNA